MQAEKHASVDSALIKAHFVSTVASAHPDRWCLYPVQVSFIFREEHAATSHVYSFRRSRVLVMGGGGWKLR